MILVTGATGNIGRPLVRQLHAAGVGPLRALTRDPARGGLPDGVAVVGGDLARPDSLKSALAGVRSLFLPSGLGADAEVLAAARDAGVEHVVLVSSITVETHPHLPQAAANAAVERALRESGMAWTVLRPTQFASNALWWAEAIRAGGAVRLPYPEVGLPAVHPADIAAVAGAALTEPGHRGRTHALTGPARVTAREQVETIADVLGREARWEAVTRETAHAELAPFLGAGVADAVLDLMGGDVNDALLAVHDTVPRVTGKPGRTFRQWAEENATAFAP
ncbi:NAD(P)H-binding protein [Streptomyces millisiae]|uniref:NAD(P)H-binding protein n=1 Tax=Streptomyces millisiae TaxID=3075542 RepID=A0ABU2LUM2_9ACTN|nr:NAD(P)H-binding protein [Streptomyces sp. DSM 44918]MDT0321256.1 NAD(P)H-binding protein [Streptomyces sp. DSM 44918]